MSIVEETTAAAAESMPTTLDEVTSERLLSTLTAGSERETAAPVAEPETDDVSSETKPVAETAPAGDSRPAEAGAPKAQATPETTPQTQAPQRSGPRQPETLEEALRVIESVRGQVGNAAQQAAQQAAAQAREEAEAKARTDARDLIKGELEGMIASGDLTVEQANAIWARKQEGWAAEDRQVKETEFATREAGIHLRGIDAEARDSLNHLYHAAAEQMAADTGLTVDQVREYWDSPEERERFQRAVMHHKLAEKFPGKGFNATALEDYLEAKVATMGREATIHRDYTTKLAAKDREIADLKVQLSREEASNDGIARRDAAPRGGGGERTKAPKTLEDVTSSGLLARLKSAR